MNIPAHDDEGRPCIIVAFVGGDYTQWAIVHYGSGHPYALPLGDVIVDDVRLVEEAATFERSRKALTSASVPRPSMTNAIGGHQTGRGVR